MEGMRNLLCGKSLRVVKRLVGDILGVQVVADPLGYGHIPLLAIRITTLPKKTGEAIALPESVPFPWDCPRDGGCREELMRYMPLFCDAFVRFNMSLNENGEGV
jgi:hypothetical protein